MRLIAIVCLLALAGCARTSATPDKYEVLIHHLSRRVTALNLQITKTENQCLAEENAMLGGRRVVHSSPEPSAGLNRTIDDLLDAEDFIEEHNRRYPNLPWADVKDILTTVCRLADGADCKANREARDSQMREEAREKPKAR